MIKLENVTKIIQDNPVIQDISLELKGGNIYGFCGYNGCGKTMLMRLICGLIIPTSGQIWVNEKKVGKDIDFPARTGVLIENPVFLPGFDGYYNLKFLADINAYIDKAAIENTLRRVGLDNNKKKVKKYSLGMKQRLGIAAAIMEKPDIIILDEPTNALDVSGVEMVRQVLMEERARGAIVILACHNDQFLREVSDTIFQMDNGKIMKEETLHE